MWTKMNKLIHFKFKNMYDDILVLPPILHKPLNFIL